jgi:hypothetical protein
MDCLGVVICATGISSREEKSIQLYATELGAKYSPHFTKKITHLIVKKVGSEKHAVEIHLCCFSLFSCSFTFGSSRFSLLDGTETEYFLCGDEMVDGLQVSQPPSWLCPLISASSSEHQ